MQLPCFGVLERDMFRRNLKHPHPHRLWNRQFHCRSGFDLRHLRPLPVKHRTRSPLRLGTDLKARDFSIFWFSGKGHTARATLTGLRIDAPDPISGGS
jgi:hypothetical protein